MGFKDWYKNRPIINSLGNAGAIYLGGIVLAGLAEKFLEAPGLADGINLASPITAGAYLLKRTEDMKEGITKRIVQVGTTTLMGGFIGVAVNKMSSNLEWSNFLKQGYEGLNTLCSKITGTESSL
ncbi:MAG: hypothetical protein QXG18_01665 [Candidatus Pacearchaeota archaeon]